MTTPEAILDQAQQAGAQEAEVYQLISRAYPVYFEANRLKQLESNESEGIALRVWRDRAPGVAVAYGDVPPEQLVKRALTLCQFNPAETIELTPNHHYHYPTQGREMSQQELAEIGNSAIAELTEHNRDLLCSAELDCDQHTTRLINTQGTDCQYHQINLSAFFQVEWVRGEDFLEITDGIEASEELDLHTIKNRICQFLDWAQHLTSPPKGQVPIIFTPKAAPLFWETVISALNGKRVWEQSSPWSDSEGKQVLSQQISLYQDPTLPPDGCPFDDEGMPTQCLSLIDEGQLKQFYRDRAMGRLLGTGSTGNGFRATLGGYPSPALVNLIVSKGQGELQDLIAQLSEGLVVDQLLGGDATLAGDFSANIELGYRIKNGEIVGRVKDTMVAGNIYTALNQLIQLGGDRENNGSFQTPSLVVDGLSVVS